MKTNRSFYIVATVLTGLFSFAAYYTGKQNPNSKLAGNPMRIVFSTFGMGAALSLVAEFNVYAANMIGLTLATTSLVINGTSFFDLVTVATQAPTQVAQAVYVPPSPSLGLHSTGGTPGAAPKPTNTNPTTGQMVV